MRALSASSRALLLLLGLSGCDEERAPPVPAPSPPKEGLSIDDARVPVRATLAVGTEGETSWRVTLSTEPLGCEALAATYPERAEQTPGTRVDVWVARPMQTDGSLGEWIVRSAHIIDEHGGRGMTTRAAMLEQVSESRDAVKLHELELACTDGSRLVAFTGPVLAKRCERVRLPIEPRQQALAATLAGKPFPIAGATLRMVGKHHHLRLSRLPHRCDTVVTEGFDAYLELALEAGDPPRVAFASLNGDAFPDTPSGSTGKDTFRVVTDGAFTGTAELELELALAGSLDVGGYAVSLEGKVRALRCPPPDGAATAPPHPSAAIPGSATPLPAVPDAGVPPQGAPKAK